MVSVGHAVIHDLYTGTSHNKEVQKENKLFNCSLFVFSLVAAVNKFFSLAIYMQIEVGFSNAHIEKDCACLRN